MKMMIKNVSAKAAALALACFGFTSTMQAVVPPPDGGYPNFNTAEGQNALFSLTTGKWNTALGAFTLWQNTDGSYNTAVGTAALLRNVGDQTTGEGARNTAVGAAALLLNTTGHSNTAVGTTALVNNTGGSNNTANGDQALNHNVSGTNNTANGVGALLNNDGNLNTASGFDALLNNTGGFFNTADGAQALGNNMTGSANTALGFEAGINVTTASNVISIGAFVFGSNVNNSCYIGNIWNQASPGGAPVFVNADGKLGITTSSRRFKDDITPMDEASEALFALKPVTFRYKKEIDPKGVPQFGLVAEDVAKVNSELVLRDKDGELSTVRYEAVNAMLLNEFLKEHRKVEVQARELQEQNVAIAELKKGMATMTTQLKEQAAQIQKVSAQVEVSGPIPRVVANYP